jgi:hypothetical protein
MARTAQNDLEIEPRMVRNLEIRNMNLADARAHLGKLRARRRHGAHPAPREASGSHPGGLNAAQADYLLALLAMNATMPVQRRLFEFVAARCSNEPETGCRLARRAGAQGRCDQR